jgi:hypothetical protein
MCCCIITALKMNHPEEPPHTPLKLELDGTFFSSRNQELVSVVELDKERRAQRDEEQRKHFASHDNIPWYPAGMLNFEEESLAPGNGHRFGSLQMRPTLRGGIISNKGLATDIPASYNDGDELPPRRLLPHNAHHNSSFQPRSLGYNEWSQHDETKTNTNLPYFPMMDDWD